MFTVMNTLCFVSKVVDAVTVVMVITGYDAAHVVIDNLFGYLVGIVDILIV